jgi:type IV secretion system protein VirB6
MDDSAPITWLIGQIDSIVSAGSLAIASAISDAITPTVAICFGIYIILICTNYLRGAETEPVFDFGFRIMGFAIVIGIGLNMANYATTVIPMVTGIGPDLAAKVSGGSVTSNSLDTLALHYFDILDQGYDSASSPVFPFNIGPLVLYALKAFCILVGLVPFLVAATLALIVADVGSILVADVGPLFFAFLLFPATRQYFSAWVNTALSYALIPLFVAIVAMVSVSLSTQMLSSSPTATLDDVSLKGVFLASVGNLILLFLLREVSSLASSLSAGGINARIAGGVGALASGIRSGAASSMRELNAGARGARAARDAVRALRERMSNRNNSLRKAG